MYNFILNQWKLGNLTEAQVLSFVPKYITLEQAQIIINTPRMATIV